jgi:response regulator RpfG family c-di-GMP phosphodiesterase
MGGISRWKARFNLCKPNRRMISAVKGARFSLCIFPSIDQPARRAQQRKRQANILDLEVSTVATILVLDDEPDAVVLMKTVLKRMGHEVHVFTDEDQAIAFARTCRVDLAILDIKLKKMSGVDVLAELKRIDPEMHAMMLTGFPTLDTARKAVSLGADDYCVKPIEIRDLMQQVAFILGELPSVG